MFVDTNSEKPIFLQIAGQLEDSIFTGIFPEETRVPSTNEMALLLNINPHTVLNGVNLLVEEGILYKKRGLGMFVSSGAVEKIKHKRHSQFCGQYVDPLVKEAKKLAMTKEQLLDMIERGYDDECH